MIYNRKKMMVSILGPAYENMKAVWPSKDVVGLDYVERERPKM